MGEAWKRLAGAAKSTWQKFTPTTRLLVGFGAAALLGTVIILSLTSSKVNYVPLYTGLSASDAGEVIGKLKEAGIPYRLEAGGSAILVPEANVYETRIRLASEGVPRNGVVGFELFNNTNLGSTDFERKLKYNWALQGELTRTIREMSEVEDARVHIVLPEPSLFVSEKREPTASVLLKLRPNASLSEEQVRGIAHLVAGSVEGLKAENVTILDQDGNVLSDLIAGSGSGGFGAVGGDAAARLALERKAEQDLERSVQSMLERVFGWGRVVARVNAQYDFDYQEASEEQFTPVTGETGILRSEQQTEETYQGTGAPGAAGVPGVTSNVPGYQTQQPGGAGSSTYSRTDATRNYEVNKKSVRSVTAPGRLQRLSVAVWVDGQLTPQQRQSVEAAVASAVGFNQARGDQITVESMKFEKPPELQFPSQGPEKAPGAGLPVWAWIAIATAVLGAALVALRRRGLNKAEPTPGAGVDLLVGAAEVPKAVRGEEEVPLPIPSNGDAQLVEKSIERLAKERPEQVAKLLRTWLTEEERS